MKTPKRLEHALIKLYNAFHNNDYSPLELLTIERLFLEACGFKVPLCHYNPKPTDVTNKDVLFHGLSAVVAYLCQLDGLSNVMDYSKIFEYEDNLPKYKFEVIYS